MRNFERLAKGKKIILFGASSAGARILVLELDNYDVAYFCDNDPSKWGKSFLGIPVKSPMSLANEDIDKILVVITSMYKNEIHKQLLELFGIYSFDERIFTECVPTSKNRYEQLCLHKAELDNVYSLLADDESKHKFNAIIENYKNGVTYFGNVKSKRKQYYNDIFSNCMDDDEVYIDAGVIMKEL